MVAWHGDHDAARGCVGAPRAHRAVRSERLIRTVLVVDVLQPQTSTNSLLAGSTRLLYESLLTTVLQMKKHVLSIVGGDSRAHHDKLGVDRALAQLGHSDGRGQEGVDARIGCKFGRERMPACGAGLLALRNPLVEAAQAEIVLAGRLKTTACMMQRASCLHEKMATHQYC